MGSDGHGRSGSAPVGAGRGGVGALGLPHSGGRPDRRRLPGRPSDRALTAHRRANVTSTLATISSSPAETGTSEVAAARLREYVIGTTGPRPASLPSSTSPSV